MKRTNYSTGGHGLLMSMAALVFEIQSVFRNDIQQNYQTPSLFMDSAAVTARTSVMAVSLEIAMQPLSTNLIYQKSRILQTVLRGIHVCFNMYTYSLSRKWDGGMLGTWNSMLT
jgi:hypothetical protein